MTGGEGLVDANFSELKFSANLLRYLDTPADCPFYVGQSQTHLGHVWLYDFILGVIRSFNNFFYNQNEKMLEITDVNKIICSEIISHKTCLSVHKSDYDLWVF